jgi:IS30 family transposase
MKTRSPLSAEEKERAKVLHASGKAPTTIAAGMGRSHHTLSKYLRRPDVKGEVSIQREELAGMFDDVAHRTVAGVTAEDIRRANLVQKMTSAGIAVDKAAMLRNELPPTINVTVLMDVVEAIKARHALQSPPTIEAKPAPALPQ